MFGLGKPLQPSEMYHSILMVSLAYYEENEVLRITAQTANVSIFYSSFNVIKVFTTVIYDFLNNLCLSLAGLSSLV